MHDPKPARSLPAMLLLWILGRSAMAAPVDAALSADPPHDPAHPATMVELTIPSHGARLPGHIYLAAGAGPHPTVVLLHGLPGNERNLDIAQALRRFGFNTLFFHYRGAWGAEGDYRLTQLPQDALAVLDYLRVEAELLRVDPAALSVLGHSLGGYAALAAGSRDTGLACVIALSPANLAVYRDQIAADGPAIAGLKDYADSLFMLAGFSGERLVEELAFAQPSVLDTTTFGPGLAGKSVLMLVGEDDAVTPPESMFNPVVAAYRRHGAIDLTAKVIAGDHGFSWSRIALTREILSWVDGRCR